MHPGLDIGSCRSLLLLWVLGVVGHTFWWLNTGVVGHTSRFAYWELSVTASGGQIVELSAMPSGFDIGSCRPLLLMADSGVVGHASRFGYWELSVTPFGGRIIHYSPRLL